MEGWQTIDMDSLAENGRSEKPTANGHSRQSSKSSSGNSDSNKENKTSEHRINLERLHLNGGNELNGESRTEMSPTYVNSSSLQISDTTRKQSVTQDSASGTSKPKTDKSLNSSLPESIPTESITIPSDANISSFTCDQLANFLKCLKVENRVISHLHSKSVDGKRFSKMKDSELDSLGMNNPVVIFFRNKSNSKTKKKGPFML